MSSRCSKRLRYSLLCSLAQGVTTKDSAATRATMGQPKRSTGAIQRVSDRPQANQTTISESW
jgi:hypothetical protein